MKRRSVIRCIVLVLPLLIVLGCSSANASTPTPRAAGATAVATVKPVEPVKAQQVAPAARVASPTARPAAVATSEPATFGDGVPPASKNNCPDTHPIKGNVTETDKIYHTPSSRSYAVTNPETCFATTADAQAAGFRAPKN